MTFDDLVTIMGALNASGVRYLIAGGVAVNLHGYTRLTQDLDIVVDLVPENALAAMRTLAELGYRPGVPVGIEDFADPELRRDWVENKHMQVFSLNSETHRDTVVDVFADAPFDFGEEYDAATVYDLDERVTVRVVRPETLIQMKEAVGRDRDLDDVVHLRWILEQDGPGPMR